MKRYPCRRAQFLCTGFPGSFLHFFLLFLFTEGAPRKLTDSDYSQLAHHYHTKILPKYIREAVDKIRSPSSVHSFIDDVSLTRKEYSENEALIIFVISRKRFNPERTSLTFNKRVFCKNAKQQRQNRSTLSCLKFGPLPFLHRVCVLNTGMESYGSNLFFEHSRLHNSLIF